LSSIIVIHTSQVREQEGFGQPTINSQISRSCQFIYLICGYLSTSIQPICFLILPLTNHDSINRMPAKCSIIGQLVGVVEGMVVSSVIRQIVHRPALIATITKDWIILPATVC